MMSFNLGLDYVTDGRQHISLSFLFVKFVRILAIRLSKRHIDIMKACLAREISSIIFADTPANGR